MTCFQLLNKILQNFILKRLTYFLLIVVFEDYFTKQFFAGFSFQLLFQFLTYLYPGLTTGSFFSSIVLVVSTIVKINISLSGRFQHLPILQLMFSSFCSMAIIQLVLAFSYSVAHFAHQPLFQKMHTQIGLLYIFECPVLALGHHFVSFSFLLLFFLLLASKCCFQLLAAVMLVLNFSYCFLILVFSCCSAGFQFLFGSGQLLFWSFCLERFNFLDKCRRSFHSLTLQLLAVGVVPDRSAGEQRRTLSGSCPSWTHTE